MNKSSSLSGRLNRVIIPLEELLAGRGPRGAAPVRLLLIALLFCFLFWKLRRLAGMAEHGVTARPKARRMAAQAKVAASGGESAAGAAVAAYPCIPPPDIGPAREPVWPDSETADFSPYGDKLRRLIQQPEIQALLDASPRLKPSLRRLLSLLGTEIPPELAPSPRSPRRLQPKPPVRTAQRRRPAERPRTGRAHGPIMNPDRGFALRPRGWPPPQSKSAWPHAQTRACIITV